MIQRETKSPVVVWTKRTRLNRNWGSQKEWVNQLPNNCTADLRSTFLCDLPCFVTICSSAPTSLQKSMAITTGITPQVELQREQNHTETILNELASIDSGSPTREARASAAHFNANKEWRPKIERQKKLEHRDTNLLAHDYGNAVISGKAFKPHN